MLRDICGRSKRITWIHLSDWHQKTPESMEQTGVAKVIADDIRKMREREHLNHIDFIVFSGDIAHTADSDEYNLAADGFLDAVVTASFRVSGHKISEEDHHDYIKGRRKRDVFLVPGNHDVSREEIQAFHPEASLLLKDLWDTKILSSWQKDATIQARLLRPFDAFGKFSDSFVTRQSPVPPATHNGWKRETFDDHSFVDNRLVNDIEVTVCGFNSAVFCGRSQMNGVVNDYGFLFIGPEAREKVLQGVPDRKLHPKDGNELPHLRIAILHHPFSWLTHGDRSDTRTDLLNKFDFILMGHEHEQRLRFEQGNQGESILIPAGPSYDRVEPDDERYALAYNIVHLDLSDPENMTGEVWLRRLTTDPASKKKAFRGDERSNVMTDGRYPLRVLPGHFERIREDRPAVEHLVDVAYTIPAPDDAQLDMSLGEF